MKGAKTGYRPPRAANHLRSTRPDLLRAENDEDQLARNPNTSQERREVKTTHYAFVLLPPPKDAAREPRPTTPNPLLTKYNGVPDRFHTFLMLKEENDDGKTARFLPRWGLAHSREAGYIATYVLLEALF
ncbi:hypothetical protein VTO42DRAFT_1401 [Malbranchea cinnamomea]